jgi:hypothetical protein
MRDFSMHGGRKELGDALGDVADCKGVVGTARCVTGFWFKRDWPRVNADANFIGG